jgi:hypothetical protein
MKKRLLQTAWGILLLLLAGLQGLEAQPYRVEAGLDTNRLKIGDQTRLHITLHQPETANVRFPVVKDHVAGGIEVLKSFPRDTLTGEETGQITIHQRYLITSFDSGAVNIPSLPFAYPNNGRRDSILTPPVDLYVETFQVDTTRGIFGIKGPLGVPLTLMEVLPWIMGAVALGLIVWGVVYLISKKRRREPVFQPARPSEPAHEYALRELDRLYDEKPWDADRLKHYYTRLTDILRNYLWMRYGIRTLERTTDEILGSLKESELDDDKACTMLAENLRFADLVKFARLRPGPDDNDASLQQAYDFVHATKYVPETAQENEQEENSSENTYSGQQA